MKLRNKKTGKIIELLAKPSFVKRNDDYLQSEVNTFDSLAELNEEWEDYKEPKKHYFTIDGDGVLVCRTAGDFLNEGLCKQIGNYFETREEAEKAVEKLKAWKRLRDKGFMFFNNKTIGEYGNVSYIVPFPKTRNEEADLDLLFGGEE